LEDFGLPCVFHTGQNGMGAGLPGRSEEHTSELQSRFDLVCRLLLEKKKKNKRNEKKEKNQKKNKAKEKDEEPSTQVHRTTGTQRRDRGHEAREGGTQIQTKNRRGIN